MSATTKNIKEKQIFSEMEGKYLIKTKQMYFEQLNKFNIFATVNFIAIVNSICLDWCKQINQIIT